MPDNKNPPPLETPGKLIKQAKSVNATSETTAADMALINNYTLKELAPEDVYTFSVTLCDNEVDRDEEKFTDACLSGLAPLFEGKTGIFNHSRNAKDQTARIFRTELVTVPAEKNRLGEPLKRLTARAYMLRNENTAQIIQNIEGGILKEVSVGFAVRGCVCSICGSKMHKWWGECAEGHQKGAEYDGQLCYGALDGAEDAYEFSFVAVPAQRGAGVTKGAKGAEVAVNMLLEIDPAQCPAEEAAALQKWLNSRKLVSSEHAERERILSENQKFIKKGD